MSTNLVDKVKARQAEKRAAAAGRFRELLLRAVRPAAVIEDALVEVMAELGVQAAELPDFQTLVGRLRQCELLADNVENCEDELIRKHKVWADAMAWAEKARADLAAEIDAKLVPLQAALAAAESTVKDAKQARANARGLFEEWHGFVGGASLSELRAARRARILAAAPRALDGPTEPAAPASVAEEQLADADQSDQ